MALDLSGPDGINEFLAGPIAAWPHCTMRGNKGSRRGAGGQRYIDVNDKIRHRRAIMAWA
jgi:hypothetical protein